MHHYNIDKLTVRGDLLFGWGWFVGESPHGFPIALALQHEDGHESTVVCLRSGRRDDVAAAFPEIKHAAESGFMIQGRVKDGSPIVSANLRLQPYGEGDSQVSLDVPNIGQLLSPDTYWSATRASRALLRNGMIGTARIASRRAGAAVRRSLRRLSFRSTATRGATLIIDHDLGGGANVFRRQLVNRLRESGDVFILKPRVSSLDYEIEVHSAEGDSSAVYSDLKHLIAFLDDGEWSRLIVNELVSYPSPLKMVSWIKDRLSGSRRPSEATLFLHDFYAVCPQWTLVGRSGVFCGIPDARECSACMQTLRTPFLSYLEDPSVPDWRSQWLPLFQLCDVRAFSQSTVDIVRKAFPELHSKDMRVEPHSTDYFVSRKVDCSRNPGDFRIGVVGHISGPKGAAMVEAAAERIRELGLPLSIVVIGSLESTRAGDRIIHAGTFTPETLANKLEEYAVNACWIPSVCPETFSFVTSELMALDVPVTCFDLGAPAERVSKYYRGRVIKDFDICAVLDHFMDMRDKLVATHSESRPIATKTPFNKAQSQ
jgi:glycosyltransferase involved in cell wall biosynthesis